MSAINQGTSILLLTAVIAATSCASAKTTDAPNQHEVDWTYSGARGPEHWAELGGSFTSCCHSKKQSPIDIRVNREGSHEVELVYAPSHEVLINNGHTVELQYNSGSRLIFDDTPYNLLQFHFHTPSEHHVDGQSYPLEAHLVHVGPAGEYLVVSVLFDVGDENAFLERFLPDAPEEEGRTEKAKAVNVGELFTDDPGFYLYKGSLTTPPCTEGVTWLVLDQPNQASASQIKVLTLLEGMNNRPEQSKGERQVEHFH